MSKCLGCGSVLQNADITKDGYTPNLDNEFCKRCFDITHYNKYVTIDKDNDIYLKKIDLINKTGDLVILTLDFFNMFDFNSLNLSNPVIIVITKSDLIPRSVNYERLLSSINGKLNIKSKLIVSSEKNYNLDLLMKLVNKYKVSKNVYVVGLTNAGKSSLIKKVLKNYSSNRSNITVSNLPSTTLDFIVEKASDDLFLIDTPGLLDDGNIINFLNIDLIKKIVPKKEVNPIIYQVKRPQSFIVEDFLRLDIFDINNIIFYISNSLIVRRVYKESDNLLNLKKYHLSILSNQDLVIKGLGFIKFKKKCSFDLYLLDGVKFYIRNSIV